MAPDDANVGKRFSHIYIERGEPTQDSRRMRRRIAALLQAMKGDYQDYFRGILTKELGIDVPLREWPKFYGQCEMRDMLDSVTVIYRHMRMDQRTFGFSGSNWCNDVRRVFSEENVHYTVDNEGGVHFSFDREFAVNRASSIAALQDARYANALHAFEGSMAALAAVPPNGKAAVRGVFSAAEGVFRLLIPRAPRLGAAELDGLLPLLQQVNAQDETTLRSSMKMLSSLKDWVDGAHFYRHEQGTEQIAQPPLKWAVYIVSTGAAHLRWLAELDAAIQESTPRVREGDPAK